MRNFYTKQHRFYCGIDLHARLLAICLVDHETATVVCRVQIPADNQLLLDTLAPYRDDVVVAVECLFAARPNCGMPGTNATKEATAQPGRAKAQS
jgi:hypothetical protein